MVSTRVVPLPEVPGPDTGVPEPVAINDEQRSVLAYRSGTSTAVLVFEGCAAVQFGYPNDEALHTHSLWRSGLEFYGVFEVLASPWLQHLRTQNRSAFPEHAWGEDLRHFIVTFHDSTFECLARDLSTSLSDDRPSSAARSALG